MLLENEKLDFNDNDDLDSKLSDDEINSKYIEGVLRIVTEQARYPLNTISSMVNSEDYELNPDFQRRHRWSIEKKSRLIESLIMNVPIPPIFLYESDYSHYEVMDGLQRLSTISDFYEDKFELQGLQLWSELNGRTYSTLPSKIKKGIDRRYVSSIILLQESADTEESAAKMKQLVFERINSGGVSLEFQETRNALYNGDMNRLTIKLSRNPYLCRFLNLPEGSIEDEDLLNTLNSIELYRKMTDVEFVLRFFAMRQREAYAKRKLNVFLDAYLDKANGLDSNVLQQLEGLFNETMKFAYDLFGEKIFRMYSKRMFGKQERWGWSPRITVIVYDSLGQVLCELLEDKEIYLEIAQKVSLEEKLKDFYVANIDSFDSRKNNKSDIDRRIELFRDFFTNLREEN